MRSMRVLVAGLRGIPGVEGGVESHAEQLYPRLAALDSNLDIEVTSRSPYHPAAAGRQWRGVRLKCFWSPAGKGLEAFAHTLMVVLYAAVTRPDILHLHAIGPGLFVPLAKLFGLKVVFTHHGPDYDREKWGPLAKRLLKIAEAWACRFSDQRIVISRHIQDTVRQRFSRESVLIPNGVQVVPHQAPGDLLRELGVKPGRYVLQVSRLVPEKRQEDLIEAFNRAAQQQGMDEWRLLIVGTCKQQDKYVQQLLAKASDNPKIVFTGFRTGTELRELYSNAGLFVLPSTHEGLPIAMLEALSYGLRVAASDIPANLEVGLSADQYFPLRDVEQLSQRIVAASRRQHSHEDRCNTIDWVQRTYNWDNIARETYSVYCDLNGNQPDYQEVKQ